MDLTPDPKQKLKYPRSVWFIVLNELCERFNYYGLRTVLVLYLTTILKFNGDESTIIYHSFVFLAYLMPLVGAIIADSYWGKFKTIIRLSIVYAVGNVVLTGASVADTFTLDVQKIITLLGLFLICVGTGGIKPCVLAFGGDQFKLPQQQTQLQHYITHFMIAINAGSLVSTFLTPELRHNVHCFGKNTCFPLAFGVPAVLMFTAIAIFFAGKNMYVKKKPEHNVIVRTFGCLFYALRKKLTSPSSNNHGHWLDHAKAVYTETEVSDTKTALNVITVFTAYPVFWALYEQQGSRWTLQATLMNGRLDFLNWVIKPDQMQALVPFFGLVFLFLFDVALYPLLAKIGIRKPLQKLTLSGCLAIVGFIITAILQSKIFGKSTVIPSGEGRLNIYNGFDCQVYVRSPSLSVDLIRPLDMVNVKSTLTSREEIVQITFKFDPACNLVAKNVEFNTAMTVIDEKEVSYYLTISSPNSISLNRIGTYDNLIKDKYGNPSLRVLTDYSFDYDHKTISLISVDDDTGSTNSYSLSSFREMNYNTVIAGRYNLILDGNIILTTINLIPATLYTLILQQDGDHMDLKLFTTDEGNYIHMLWQLPQYLCMIMADVIFVVTSSEFSFTEAPDDIKSFISAFSLLTTAIGNLLVVIISSFSIQNQMHEYLLYAAIMGIDTLLMVYFSVTYRDRSVTNINETTSNHEDKKDEITVF